MLNAVARRLGYRLAPLDAAAPEHDALTGLASRATLESRLAATLATSAAGVAVLRIDIDDLERVNEALSHAAGDEVIRSIGHRIAMELGDVRDVARISGAAFVATHAPCTDADEAMALANRLRRAAAEPVLAADHVLQATVSVGIALGEPGADVDHVLRNAALAVRRARDGGGDRVELAESDLAHRATQRLELEEAMRRALVQHEFRAWYQPIVDFATAEIVGYEALIRWITDDGRQIFPGEFIPVAEASGLVPELDIIVLAQSLGLLAVLPRERFLSVNVSPVSLTRPDFVRRASELLEFSRVDLRRLHLEVTETALPSDLDVVRSAMLHLSMGGAQWYFDDFGTGYSSMSNLGELPVDGLKLDMSFTRGIHAGDETSIRLAHGLLGLARGLDLATVAEGVETDAVAEVLRAQGWDQGQGWLYGKAAPLDAA